MKPSAKLTIAIATFFLCAYSTAFPQTGGSAGAFSRIGFGPRGMAMANALTAATSQGIYSYYNPALAAESSRGNQVDFSTAAMSFERSFNTLNGTFRLPPTAGITLSLINANVGDIDGRSPDGYNTGTFQTHEYQIASAMGIQITTQLSAGVGLKYYIADYHNDLANASTLGLDLGALYKFSKNLKLGLTVRDLLASYSWDSSTLYGDESSARTDHFPTQLQIGGSYSGLPDLTLSMEGGRIYYENEYSTNVRFGAAYNLHKRIVIRAGWQIDALSSVKRTNHGSAGFSVHLPFDLFSPSIDYAFIQEANNISYMHSFGLRLNI